MCFAPVYQSSFLSQAAKNNQNVQQATLSQTIITALFTVLSLWPRPRLFSHWRRKTNLGTGSTLERGQKRAAGVCLIFKFMVVCKKKELNTHAARGTSVLTQEIALMARGNVMSLKLCPSGDRTYARVGVRKM